MRKFFVLMTALTLSVAVIGQESDRAVISPENGKNIIKINPLGVLFGSFSMSYERLITPNSSLQFNANYGNINLFDIKIGTYGAGVDYRLYFSKNRIAPEGFYFSPGVSYATLSIDDVSISAFELRGVAGYQWIWDSGFQLELFIGPNYTFVDDISFADDTIIGEISGVNGTIGFSIGYNF